MVHQSTKQLRGTDDHDYKMVKIKIKTHDRLKTFGYVTETFDDVINRLIDKVTKMNIDNGTVAPNELLHSS